MRIANPKKIAGALALTLGVTLSGCGGMPENRSLNSVKQPVVTRVNYTLDFVKGAGGVGYDEQQRISEWFAAMDLRYGDQLSIDDPTMSGATRDAVSDIAARYGLLVSDSAPVTPGYIQAGTARLVLTRASASVPGCPDWSAKSQANLNNALYPNYGCAVNSNMAAMVANPEDLVRGETNAGETVIMTSTKAIDSYRKKAPTGNGALKAASTGGGN